HGISRVAGAGVRSDESRQKELKQIAAYQELVDLLAETQYTVEVLDLTTKLLNENPEYYTIWNHRRRVLQHLFSRTSPEAVQSTPPSSSSEDFVTDDLQLTFVLLRKYPKCYWIWNHRNWLLDKGESLLGAGMARKLWTGELQLIGKMLHADSRNFHAWSYRRIVVAQLERVQASEAGDDTAQSLAKSEFDYTTKMINTNLSNFSAWHNRSKLILRLLEEGGADSGTRRKILDDELALICTAVNTDPYDQSIWFYHQFLMSTLSSGGARPGKIVQDLSDSDRETYYAHELDYIQDILEDEADCKWLYEALLQIVIHCRQIKRGRELFTTQDTRSWLNHLKRLDPLRKGRWDELSWFLNLED
ncbi:geranylgeranyl transferase type 2 subunit alpha, partial [Polyplosphaeria fusca]